MGVGPSDYQVCARCGLSRQVKRSRRGGVCRDCRDVLAVEELRLWEDRRCVAQ